MPLRRLAFAMLLLCALIAIPHAFAAERLVKVPDFSGQTYDQVMKAATDSQTQKSIFRSIQKAPSSDATVAPQSQNPAAGRLIVPGLQDLSVTWTPKPQPVKTGVLQTILNQWASMVRVPPVRGLNHDQAEQKLEIAKLRWSFPNGTSGVVTGANPQVGSLVEPGTSVSLTMGPVQVPVPPVAGQTYAQAQQTLATGELQIVLANPPYADGGTASYQDPQAGMTAPQGSSVRVTFTTPPPPTTDQPPAPQPEQVAVPDLAHLSVKQAMLKLHRSGLVLGEHNGPANGEVVSQNPDFPSMADPGSSVSVELKLPQVEVPSVTGDAESVAVAGLRKQGLGADVATATSWLPVTPQVVSQSPVAGEMVDPDTVVHLQMGTSSSIVPVVLGGAAVLVLTLGIVVIVKIVRKPDLPEPIDPVTPPPPPPSTPQPFPASAVPGFMVKQTNTRVTLRSGQPALRFPSLTLVSRRGAPRCSVGKEPELKRLR